MSKIFINLSSEPNVVFSKYVSLVYDMKVNYVKTDFFLITQSKNPEAVAFYSGIKSYNQSVCLCLIEVDTAHVL